MDYELAAYEPAQRDDYLRLLHDAWADDALTGAEFDWWFARNPAGSLMSVARDDGRVLGVASHSLYRMVIGGEEKLASFSVHATTDPTARGRGIFVALERKHEQEAQERGVAVVLAFASAPTAPLFLGPLGWSAIGQLRIWARPFPVGGKEADPVGEFEHDDDAASAWASHIVRDAEYLNWRYLDSPREYAAYRATGGYVVVGHKRHRGRAVALVADLVGPTRRLLRACIAAVRPGTHLLFGVPGPGEAAAYASCGFVPTPRTLNFMGKALAGPLETDARAWRMTLGDTDFF
ncbi:MAG: GNAT family N-acetyltransferase [Gaiellaceae bacterium]